jgi:hypothetical protein
LIEGRVPSSRDQGDAGGDWSEVAGTQGCC